MKKDSIWTKDIHSPVEKIWARIPSWLPTALAAGCLLVCVLHPLPIAIFALKKQSVDYPYVYYHQIARNLLYPFVKHFGGLALVIALAKNWAMLRREWREHPVFVLFVLLVVWMLLATQVNGWDYYAKIGTESMGESVWVEAAYFILLFPLCALLVSKRWKTVLLRLFLFVSTCLSVAAFVLWKTQLTSALVIGWEPCFSCIHININYYGYYLTVAVSLSAAMVCAERTRLWRGYALFCLALNTVALSYNDTLGAWVGSFFACLFLIVALRIRDGKFSVWAWAAFGIFIGSMTVAGLANGLVVKNLGILSNDVVNIATDAGSEVSMQAGSGRWIIWLRFMTLIKAHPWFGLGFECIEVKGIESYTFNNRPHNELMQYAVFYGIPAAVLYFAGCLGVYLRALRYRAQLDDMTLAALTAAFGYLVGSLFGLTVYNTAPYLFIMLGLGYVHRKRSD